MASSVPNRIIAACLVSTLAFWAYTQTLLPGVDFGDTGGFQATVLWPENTARQAYPLYYNLARPFVRAVSPDNPARGLNLFSAVWGAAAAGLLTIFGAAVTGSVAAGVLAGLFLAFSYTFWTQAIIAEVYTLHLTLVGLCLLALHGYAVRPTRARLAIFFAIYAAAFGNHLSTILLLVPFAIVIVRHTPEPCRLLRPSTVALALGIAALGALQYWPNLMSVWRAPDAPATAIDRLAAFWFDVTKADWREAMVLGVDTSQTANRFGMWWFDVRQQLGIPGLLLAAAGAATCATAACVKAREWALALLVAWVISTAFALTYNVGDSHVFFLPSTYIMAFFAGAAVAWLPAVRGPGKVRATGQLRGPDQVRATVSVVLVIVTSVVVSYAGWRAWDTWPAVDRHADRRGEALVTRMTLGLDRSSALLVAQLDWQIENALLYYGRFIRSDVDWVRLPDVFPRFPFLVGDAHAASRDVVLTAGATRDVVAAYGAAFPLVEDNLVPVPTLADAIARIPRGAVYVLGLLSPPRDVPLDRDAFAAALAQLTGDRAPTLTTEYYQVIGGLAGDAPLFVRSSALPFREDFRLLDEPFTVRMESWPGTDTFRRAGFGHILRGREHVLIVERGVSLVWFDASGNAAAPVYEANLFAARPRYRIPAAIPRLAGAPTEP